LTNLLCRSQDYYSPLKDLTDLRSRDFGFVNLFSDGLQETLDNFIQQHGAVLKQKIVDLGTLNDHRRYFGLEAITEEDNKDPASFPRAYLKTVKEYQEKGVIPICLSFIEGQTRAVGCTAIMTASIVDHCNEEGIVAGSLTNEHFESYLSRNGCSFTEGVDVLDCLRQARESDNFFLDNLISVKIQCPASYLDGQAQSVKFNAREFLQRARELSELHQREKKQSSERPFANEIYGILERLHNLQGSQSPKRKAKAFNNKSMMYRTTTVKKGFEKIRPGYLALPEFERFLENPTLNGMNAVYLEMENILNKDGSTCPALPIAINNKNTKDECHGCYPGHGDDWGMDPLELNAIPIFVLGCRAASRALNGGVDNWSETEKDLTVRLLSLHNRTYADGVYPADDKSIPKEWRAYGLKLLWFGSYLSNIANWGLLHDKLDLAMVAFAISEENLFKASMDQILKEHSESLLCIFVLNYSGSYLSNMCW